jgi:hypothetical protein
VHCNGPQALRAPQSRQRRMVDIHPDLCVVHQRGTLLVGGSKIVVFRCANCEPVDVGGQLTLRVLASHFAEGRT